MAPYPHPLVDRSATALQDLLADVRWESRGSRREMLPRGTAITLAAGTARLVYIDAGSVQLGGGDRSGVADLASGDIAFALGRERVRIRAGEASTVIVVSLHAAGAADRLAPLPDLLSVHGFAEAEPNVAALAAGMGCPTATRTGDSAICGHIATTVFSVAVRSWVERGCAPEGWPARTQDPFLARAIDAVHADPARPWTVRELADVAAMSRSVFAQRFRCATGRAPLAYVTGVRMAAAAEHLRDSRRSVAETSRMLGYGSEDGFSRAFRRHVGMSPSQWRRLGAAA